MKTLLFSLLIISTISHAQDSLYSKVIVSTTNNYSVESGSLDKYHHIGQTGSTQTQGFFTYLDSLGTILYNQYYSVSNDDNQTHFDQIISSSDDRFVMCGSSYLNTTNKWIGNLTKVDSTGSIIWSKQLKGTNGNSFNLMDVSESSDSTYLTIGVDLEDFNAAFFEIDRNGNTLNSFTLTSSAGYFSFTGILEISDTSIVLIGSENIPFQDPKAIIICCSKTGSIYWTNSMNNAVFAKGEQGTQSIWIPTRYNYELAITSLDKSGQFNSLNTYGHNYSSAEDAEIAVIKDSTVVLSYGENHIPSAILLKTVIGSTVFSTLYPQFCPTDLIKRENEGMYVLGTGPLYGIKKFNSFDHSSIVRMDSSFSESICIYSSGSGNAMNIPLTNSSLTSLSIGAPGSVANLDLVSEVASLESYFGCVDFLGSLDENESNFLSIYPNPGNGKLTVENASNQPCILIIRNSLGILLDQEKLTSTNQSVDLCALAAGWYVLELVEMETGNRVGKQVFIKN
nr:T9SS type A sorting domain-containing protein [uncultured Fluviicola sp.]